MRKALVVKFLLLLCCLGSLARAQQAADIQLHTEPRGKDIAFILDFSQPFYVGNNVYVLHIGDETADQSTQTIKNRKGKMVFLLPKQVLGRVENGRKIWLSYGHMDDIPEERLDAMSSKGSRYCRVLGTFNKDMIR